MRKLLSTAFVLALIISLGTAHTAYAANQRTIPTSGGNRSVTYIEIALDETYSVGAMSAEETFGRSAATLAEFAGIVADLGTDVVVFPINFFIPYDGTNVIVGGLVSQGRIVRGGPDAWLNHGVGFTETNEMFLFDGHIHGDNVYGQLWHENRLYNETVFNAYPHLIANGQLVEVQPAPGMTQEWIDGRVFRAFMGQRTDGTLVVGNVSGTNIAELQEIAVYLNLVNATNIDGGASASIWRNGSTITQPGRQLASVAYIANNRVAEIQPPVQPLKNVGAIGVAINGQPVVFDGQGPDIVDGRTLVPVRGVFEALGFDVDWYQPTQTATLTGEGHVVVITVGNDAFTTNGESHGLDVPAQIIGGRTMLPIRAVLESVGYDVDWDEATRTVLISSQSETTDLQATLVGRWVYDDMYAEFFADGTLYDHGWSGEWMVEGNLLLVFFEEHVFDIEIVGSSMTLTDMHGRATTYNRYGGAPVGQPESSPVGIWGARHPTFELLQDGTITDFHGNPGGLSSGEEALWRVVDGRFIEIPIDHVFEISFRDGGQLLVLTNEFDFETIEARRVD